VYITFWNTAPNLVSPNPHEFTILRKVGDDRMPTLLVWDAEGSLSHCTTSSVSESKFQVTMEAKSSAIVSKATFFSFADNSWRISMLTSPR
jgi:hypothetical protein